MSTTLPVLTAADAAEIRENRMRLGLHTDEERCYCPKCVNQRTQTPLNDFVDEMHAYGFNKQGDGLPLDWDWWSSRTWVETPSGSFAEPPSPIAPTNSLLQRIRRARFEKRFGYSYLSDKFHAYYGWSTPTNLNAVQQRRVKIVDVTVDENKERFFVVDIGDETAVAPAGEIKLDDTNTAIVGEKDWSPQRGAIPSPSMGRLNRFGLGYLKLSARRHTTSLSGTAVPEIPDPFKGRALTACVGTENRTKVRKTDSYSQYIEHVSKNLYGGEDREPYTSKPDAATYTGVCMCPHHGKADIHFAKTFTYPDGSIRYECAHEVRAYRDYLMVFKPSNFVPAETVKPNKNWKREFERAEVNGEVAVHSIYEKWKKPLVPSGHTPMSVMNEGDADESGADTYVDVNVNEDGDEISISSFAEAYGLDWIEDDLTRQSKDSAFDIDAEKLLELAKKFYGVDLRYVTHDEVSRDPHFSNVARAYVIRVRYLDGYKLTDSEKKQLSREVKFMQKMIEGKCPAGTCPNDRCANPALALSERAATHAANLPHTREKMVDRVGQWYCVVDGFIKWLPDPSKFEGDTESDRVEAAFDELVRVDLLSVARQARKDGSDPDEAVKRRQAAFDAVAEISKVVSEAFEEAVVGSTSSDESWG